MAFWGQRRLTGKGALRRIGKMSTLHRPAVPLIVLLCAFVAISNAVQAQSREETVEFLFRDTRINDVWFNVQTTYSSRAVTNYSIVEHGCVVHVTAVASGTTTNWGDPPMSYSGKPISVTVDFNKLLMNRFTKDANTIEVKVGDLGAVYGTDWSWNNKNTDFLTSWNHDRIVLERRNFNQSNLSMYFFNDKIARASDAFQYFIQTFCPGKRSAF